MNALQHSNFYTHQFIGERQEVSLRSFEVRIW